MDNSAFMGDVESSPGCQYGEEFHPPVHWVVGRDMLLSTMDLAVIYEGAPASSGHGTGAPEEHWGLTDERVFVEIQVSSGEVPEHRWRGKKKIRDQMHGRG